MSDPQGEHSLATSVSRLRAHLRWPAEFPATAPLGIDEDAQWHDAEVVINDPAMIKNIIESHAAIVGSRQAGTAATLLWKDYCQVFSLLPVASWFIDRRVPDMASANLRLRVSAHPPLIFPAPVTLRGTSIDGDPGTGADLVTVSDEEALVERLVATVWDEHLEPFGRAISDGVGVDLQILKGLAISVAVAALPRVAALGEESARDQFGDAEMLVAAMGGKNLIELATLTPPGGNPEPMALRFVCCQAHRVKPHLNCSTCPLITDDARTTQLETHGYAWARR